MQPPPGVTIDTNDLRQFERLRHEHQLAPKDPSTVCVTVCVVIPCACVYVSLCGRSYLHVCVVGEGHARVCVCWCTYRCADVHVCLCVRVHKSWFKCTVNILDLLWILYYISDNLYYILCCVLCFRLLHSSNPRRL